MADSVKAVFKRRDRLLSSIEAAAGCDVLTGPDVGIMTDAALSRLPKNCKYTAIYQTLSRLIGKTFDPVAARRLCWGMAADVASLRAGNPISPGVFPSTPTPVIVQFLACTRLPTPKDRTKKGFPIRYRARVLVGRGAPFDVEFIWSSAFVNYLATKPEGLGFRGRVLGNKPASGRPFLHYSLLVGMRMIVGLAMADGRVRVEGTKCPSGLRNFNRSLIEMRWRSGFACPFAFTHHCHQCPKGQNSCPVAVRPSDLVVILCRTCGKQVEADPTWNKEVCVECSAKGSKFKNN